MGKLLYGVTDMGVYLVAYDYHTGSSADAIKAKIVELNTEGLNNKEEDARHLAESKDFMLQESLYFIKTERLFSDIKKEFSFVDENDDFIIFKIDFPLFENVIFSKKSKEKILPILRNQ